MAHGGSRLLVLVAFFAIMLTAGCSHSTSDNALPLGDAVSTFVDPAGTMTFAQVRQRRDELFADGATRDGSVEAEPPGSARWLYFPAPDPRKLLAEGWGTPFSLVIKDPGLQHVDLYVVRNDGVAEQQWDWRDERRLNGTGYRHPFFGIDPAQLVDAVVFMRIVSNAPIRNNIWLSDFQSFFGNYNAETTALSVTVGVKLAILIYILALGVSLRSQTNLWLAACMASGLVYIVCQSGFLETQIWPGATQLSRTLAFASRLAIQATLVGFAANFLRLKTNQPTLMRLSHLIAGILGTLAAISCVDVETAVRLRPLVLPVLALCTIAFVFVLCVAAVFRNPRRVALFFAGWLPALIPIVGVSMFEGTPRFGANIVIDDGVFLGISLSLVIFTILSSFDVRQREKLLREEILDNVARFRGFAEIGTDSFWEIDDHGKLTFLSGKPVDHADLSLGVSLVDRLAELSSAEFLRPIRETVAGRLPFDDRRIRLGNDERDVWISVSGRAIDADADGSHGKRAIYRGVIRDVTEETERESRRIVEQQMLALGQLVGSVAHEVNNLIHPIVNLTKRLRNRQAAIDDPASARLMDLIDMSSRQAAKVVSELLASTRSQRWKDIDRPLSLAVDYSVEAVRPALPSSVKVDLVTEEVNEPTVKVGDVLQIISNLLSNAVHAMNGKGQVLVSLTSAPDGAKLAVSDDGAGMDEGVRQRAMQPFFTTKTDGRGTGVGLYVVQRIVRDYGGWVTINSAPDVGTTFTIFFPLRKGADGQSAKIADGAGRG